MNESFKKNLPWFAVVVVVIALIILWWWKSNGSVLSKRVEKEIATTTQETNISATTPILSKKDIVKSVKPLEVSLSLPKDVESSAILVSPDTASIIATPVLYNGTRLVYDTQEYQVQLREVLASLSLVLEQLRVVLVLLNAEITKMNLE